MADVSEDEATGARWEIRAVPDAPPSVTIERPTATVYVTPQAVVLNACHERRFSDAVNREAEAVAHSFTLDPAELRRDIDDFRTHGGMDI